MGRKRSNLSRNTRRAKRLQLRRRLENQEERNQRLQKARDRAAMLRANETEEEHQIRNEENRIKAALRRNTIRHRLKLNRFKEIIKKIENKDNENDSLTDDSNSQCLEPEQIDEMLDIELICVGGSNSDVDQEK